MSFIILTARYQLPLQEKLNKLAQEYEIVSVQSLGVRDGMEFNILVQYKEKSNDNR